MVARVIVDISNSEIDKIFDYEIPSHLELHRGDRVLVPFANKKIEGFCIDIVEKSEYPSLKEVDQMLDDFTAITEEMLDLMHYLKEKFFIRYVDLLRLFIPSKLRGGRVRELVKSFVMLRDGLTFDEAKKIVGDRAKTQLAVLETLRGGACGTTELNSSFSPASVKALIDKGVCVKIQENVGRVPYENIKGSSQFLKLTDGQVNAIDKIFSTDKTTSLLFGVTGCGKTEVYLNCIEKVLAEGKTAIMLVPEISLTPQILRLFRGRFGDNVAMLHSGLSDGERYDEWRRLHSGDARIVVGARSAIFAPLQNVGLIVIDEEHDSSYNSESNPRYQTIDVAKFRAEFNNAKLVLGSATPNIESYLLAKQNEYQLITISQRANKKEMPKLEIVDMAEELRRGNTAMFSAELKKALIDTVADGNQAMVFLNRRGYASFVMCKECGYIAKCSDCDISLTYHAEDNEIKCHYCNKRYQMLTNCPVCQSEKLRYGKVGTQRIVEEIHKIVPNARILRMDNDTTQAKTAYLDILSQFSAREADILVGTQMIAKGHDFPDVTLVGILDADMSLYFSDYRSSERTFQLITQVAGRAGRSDKAGRVVLQTFAPRHYVFSFAKNYDYTGFFVKENNSREVTKFPPYSKIFRVLVSGVNEQDVVDCAKKLYLRVKDFRGEHQEDFIYLQAMKAPIKRIQNKFRYQIIARVTPQSHIKVLARVNEIVEMVKNKKTWIFIETNPQNMN